MSEQQKWNIIQAQVECPAIAYQEIDAKLPADWTDTQVGDYIREQSHETSWELGEIDSDDDKLTITYNQHILTIGESVSIIYPCHRHRTYRTSWYARAL